ncbi:hypothetical protein [Janibacter cremeus]|uniref:Uncharacterized protein n=1 Tax=Janibacter cremeus TaxID=1285192 RepID=A0A852VK38_9MICO|nr:hypothetical protein [Janibacter cremeus]NYF97432.1 hypothetical protein [Janibacter cremeus]
MVEVREVLRAWLEGAGLHKVAERAGVDRKTARRYVAAAEAAGLAREAGVEAVTDALVGAVVDAVRPVRPDGGLTTTDMTSIQPRLAARPHTPESSRTHGAPRRRRRTAHL